MAEQMQPSWVVVLVFVLSSVALTNTYPQDYAELESWVIENGGKVHDLGPSLTECIQPADSVLLFVMLLCRAQRADCNLR
jgi:hypothetical protein